MIGSHVELAIALEACNDSVVLGAVFGDGGHDECRLPRRLEIPEQRLERNNESCVDKEQDRN